MRKVISNKWFLLTLLLTISLSAFSLIVYRKADSLASSSGCCRQNREEGKKEMMWDPFSRPFSSFISLKKIIPLL